MKSYSTAAFDPNFRIGLMGGGQLGKMLLPAAADLNLSVHVLDPDPQAPCSVLTPHFQAGKLTDYDTVVEWGKDKSLITIEIENVNTAALKTLESQGVKVFPQPGVIELIQDKRAQKEFYRQNGIPTADFFLVENRAEVEQYASKLPLVNKLGKEGYDGRGVQILRTAADLPKAFDRPGLLETLVDFEKEVSVIVARNEAGEVRFFPPVELVFDPEQNLVDYLMAPAQLDKYQIQEANDIARTVIEKLDMVGLLAVEMFLTREGELLVNEIAPRTHNSGHHTLKANQTSQFEQQWRAVLNLPLGSTATKSPAAMVNLLGEEGFSGPAWYEGIEKVLAVEGVSIVLYGKAQTRPFRKMGHVTLLDYDPQALLRKIQFVKEHLKVKSR